MTDRRPKKPLKTKDISPRRGEMIKPGEIIAIPGMESWSLADRRTWNLLLIHAWGDRLEDPGAEFEIALSELRGLHESNDRVRASLEKLQTTLVRTQTPSGSVATVQLLGWTDFNDDARVDGLLKYDFHYKLVPVLRQSEIYGRMQVKVLAAFTSRYSLALYEVVALKANLQRTTQEISIATLREWLGVEAGKLSRYPDFNRKAIAVAVREVNAISPYWVEIEPLKRGKKVDRVRISWGKKEPFSPAEQAAAREANRVKIGRSARIKGTVEHVTPPPSLTEAEIGKGYAAAAKLGVRLDKHAMYEDWRRLVASFPEPPTNALAHFIAFCKEQARMIR